MSSESNRCQCGSLCENNVPHPVSKAAAMMRQSRKHNPAAGARRRSGPAADPAAGKVPSDAVRNPMVGT